MTLARSSCLPRPRGVGEGTFKHELNGEGKMRSGNITALLAGCGGGVIALSGCGTVGPPAGPCVPVKGKVTLGNSPLVGGMVTFIPLDGAPNRPRPEGTVDSQG